MRASAVEMHFSKPLHTEIYRKNAAAQNHGPHFVRAWAVETRVKISRATIQKFAGKMRRRKATADTLCEPARMSRFHKSHFMRNFGPKPRPTLCASLRSRNAWQDFKRATLFFAEIKKKCRVPKPRPTDCVSLHSRNAMKRMSTFHKSQLMENFTGKMRET